MSLEDPIASLIFQAVSSPYFFPGLVAGYFTFFLFFYGTPTWEKLSFGERVIFGLIVGIPIALLTYFFTLAVYSLAVSLRTLFDFQTLWDVAAAIVVLTFGVIRQIIDAPLHSTQGYSSLRAFLTQDHFPFRYVIIMGLGVFDAFSYSFNNANVGFMVDLTILAWVIAFPLYWVFLASTVAVAAPHRFNESISLALSYVFLLGRPVMGPMWRASGTRQATLDIVSNVPVGTRFSRRKTLAILVIVLMATYIPALDNNLSLFTPLILAVTTQYSNEPIVTSSLTNQSRYVTLVSVTKSYFITRPLIPLFSITLRNPSNYSVLPITSSACNGCSLNEVTLSSKGPTNVTSAKSAGGSISSLTLEPLQGGNNSMSVVTLNYNDFVSQLGVVIGKTTLVNQSTPQNHTVIAYYALTILNPAAGPVKFDHFYVNGPPSGTKYSGTCLCPYAVDVQIEQFGIPLFVAFTVQPHTTALVTIRVEYKVSG